MLRSIKFDTCQTLLLAIIAACLSIGPIALAEESATMAPRADGTLVDGLLYGSFDGEADAADWSFNGTSYEGTITRSTPDTGSPVEHRLVFEYDLQTVDYSSPVTAKLSFRLRGVTIFPFPDVTVSVYAYPADLREDLADFSATPVSLVGQATVVARQPDTSYLLPVNDAINSALSDGSKKVAFRFQIDPQTPHDRNQAFMDATDSAPTSKPMLVITDTIPGDADGNRIVDLYDAQAFATCHDGPEQFRTAACDKLDLDLDGDVDLRDYNLWQAYFGASR
jgi:hypothetical protein